MATESGGRGAEGTGGGRDPGVPGVARAESLGVNVAALRGYTLESYVHSNARHQTRRQA